MNFINQRLVVFGLKKFRIDFVFMSEFFDFFLSELFFETIFRFFDRSAFSSSRLKSLIASLFKQMSMWTLMALLSKFLPQIGQVVSLWADFGLGSSWISNSDLGLRKPDSYASVNLLFSSLRSSQLSSKSFWLFEQFSFEFFDIERHLSRWTLNSASLGVKIFESQMGHWNFETFTWYSRDSCSRQTSKWLLKPSSLFDLISCWQIGQRNEVRTAFEGIFGWEDRKASMDACN